MVKMNNTKGYESWGSVQNADIYQVIAYMHITDAKNGGFIVPTQKNITSKDTKRFKSGKDAYIRRSY